MQHPLTAGPARPRLRPTDALRASLPRLLLVLLPALLFALAPGTVRAHNGSHADKAEARPRPADTERVAPLALTAPDVTVVDQDGRSRRFASELLRDGPVLVHFIFTSCTSVCSPLTAIVKAAREQLIARGQRDLKVLSVSVDPLNDTPAKLRSYAAGLGAGGPDWRFLTGSRASIDTILKAYGVPVGGNLDEHTPMVFVGQGSPLRWTRAYGLAGPRAIVDRVAQGSMGSSTGTSTAVPVDLSLVRRVADRPASAPAADGLARLREAAAQQAAGAPPQKLAAGDAASYFTNLPVVTHDRGRVRFYDDLIRGRVVLVNAFFVNCRDVCSPAGFNLARVQQRLAAERGLGPVQIVSLSVDPVADTPELLTEYARRHGAKAGWSFVTGKKENVDWVLHKLGLYVPEKEQHQAALWVGNDRTQTWVKLHALAPPEAIVAALRKVM